MALDYKYLGDCRAFKKQFPDSEKISCCTSCHEDFYEFNRDMITTYVGDGYFYTCCSLSCWFDDTRTEG